MVNVYLTLGIAAGAAAALYKREDLWAAVSSFGDKPLTFEEHPSAGGFRPVLEADGLHPFEFFALSDRSLRQNSKAQ